MVTMGPFPKGMNNRNPEFALPDGTFRNGVNVDVDNSGRVKSRLGMKKVYSGNMMRGFSDNNGVFFVDSHILKKLNADNTATSLYSGLGQIKAHDYFNSITYISDGAKNIKVENNTVSRWGITPPEEPVMSSASGILGRGEYNALYVFVDSKGVESGNSPIASIAAYKGIMFHSLPAAPTGFVLRVYMTTPNGTEFFHVADPTTTTLTITDNSYEQGNVFDLLFVSPPPVGNILCHYNGRMYVAAGKAVYYSTRFSFDHFKTSDSYEQFPDEIKIMVPVAAGIFFATAHETWFYSGNPEDGFTIIKKFDYGGVAGTSKTYGDTVLWQSTHGTIVGYQDGQCKNIQEENVSVDFALTGASVIKETNGVKQFVASLKNSSVSPLAASSFIDAEIIRRS